MPHPLLKVKAYRTWEKLLAAKYFLKMMNITE
jgi:hypothetical protein